MKERGQRSPPEWERREERRNVNHVNMQRNFGATEMPAKICLSPKGPGEVTFVIFPLKGGMPLRASRKEERELIASLANFSEVRPE